MKRSGYETSPSPILGETTQSARAEKPINAYLSQEHILFLGVER